MYGKVDVEYSPITADAVERLRKKIKLGDRVRFWEPAMYNEVNGGYAHGKYQKASGRVLCKFPHLVLVEKKNGQKTTVTYVELLRKGGTEQSG